MYEHLSPELKQEWDQGVTTFRNIITGVLAKHEQEQIEQEKFNVQSTQQSIRDVYNDNSYIQQITRDANSTALECLYTPNSRRRTDDNNNNHTRRNNRYRDSDSDEENTQRTNKKKKNERLQQQEQKEIKEKKHTTTTTNEQHKHQPSPLFCHNQNEMQLSNGLMNSTLYDQTNEHSL